MGFGNFLKGIAAQVNPFDNGKTYGTYNRKKREEEQSDAPKSQLTVSRQPSIPTTREVNNVFNKNNRNNQDYSFSLTPQNQVNVPRKSEYDYSLDVPKPKQSFGNKIRDVFDTNTEADQYRRAKGNFEKGENKDLVLENQGNIATKIRDFAVDSAKSVGRGARNTFIMNPTESIRATTAQLTGNKEALEASDYRRNKATYGKEVADRIASGGRADFGDLVGAVGDTLSVVPVASAGGATAKGISLGVRQGGRRGLVTASKGLAMGIDDALFGVRDILNLGRGARNKVLPKKALPHTASINEQAITDSVEQLIKETQPKHIPITQVTDIPITHPSSEGVPINVRNLNEPGRLIQETTGDATMATPNSLIQKTAEDIRAEQAFDFNKVNQPIRPEIDRFEGITPRSPEAPYQLDTKAASNAQDKLIDDYAAQLKQWGEGNGTQLVPDGEGGYFRTSNNVRFGDTKGKRMTKAMWREEAERQLRRGEADPAFQREFTDAVDPEVQAMLVKGERPDVPQGKPIRVKEVTDIPVVDKTEVPTGLPEQPGIVRATTQTDNQAVKTQMAAEQPPVVPRNSKGERLTPEGSRTTDTTYQVNETGQAKPAPVDDDISPARRDLIYQLSQANRQSVKDARALSAARGERAAKAAGMAEGLEGEAATIARRRGFKGELGHRGKYVGIGGEDGQRIFNELRLEAQRHPELSKRIYDLDNVEVALSRATRGTDLNNNYVGAPTKGQIELLRKYFGDEVADTVGDAVNMSKGLWDKTKEGIGEVVATPRAIMASMDLSSTIRQGGVLSSRFPKEAAQAAKEQVKYFGSTDAFNKGMKEIADRPSYAKMVKSGLDVTGTQFGESEEQFISNLAERIPGLGRGVKASERAYTGFLTKMRADVFDNITDSYAKRGIELSQRELDDLSKFINTASGRGSLGSLEDHAKTLSTTLFSPRLWKSRLDMLNPAYYAKLSGPARKYALQSAGTFASVAGTVLGLASLAGADVETDMRSSDFGKIKVGNHRFDILGGFQQNLVFAHRQLTGEKKSSTTGEVTKYARGIPDLIRGRSDEEAGVETGPYVPNRVSVATDLLGNKANPVLGAATRILQGKDRGGNPVNPLEELVTLAVPLNVSGTFETVQDIGDIKSPKDWLKASAINAPNVFGVSTQTYGETPSKDAKYDEYASAKDRARELRDNGALTKSADITKAFDDKDYESVIKGYEYQKALAESSPKTTAKELANLDGKIKEATYLKNGVPKTDDGILAKLEDGEYDKVIQGLNWKTERAEADGEMSEKSRDTIKLDIKRAELYKREQLNYADVQQYKDTNLTEWRAMADDDPELYQKLWAIDELMANNKVSYAKGNTEKQKYSLKKSGSGGRGGSRGSQWSSEYGKLTGSGSNAPKVKGYQSMEEVTRTAPRIRRTNPNIVHTIRSGRV